MANGQPVVLRQNRLRIVLGMLALDAGRVVSREALAHAVWGEKPPKQPFQQLAICVTTLRRALVGVDEDLIDFSASGYVLNPDTCEVDSSLVTDHARRARQLRAAGHNDDAAREYRRAIALWRGEVLEDVVSAEVVGEWRHRLDALRRSLLEERIELDVQLGFYREALDDLAAALDADPFNERLGALTMQALYGLGRPTEALRLHAEFRQRLRDETGADPGTELQLAHQHILRQAPIPAPRTAPVGAVDDEPEVPAPTNQVRPRQLPMVANFRGRMKELTWLDHELLGDRAPDGPRAVLITGMGGIGKTALALQWARRNASHFPDGQIYVDLRGYSDRDPVTEGHAAARFTRALGVPASSVPRDVEERIALYRSLTAEKRLLVLLDNIRSAEQVRALLPSGPGCVVIVTSRDALLDVIVEQGVSVLRLKELSEQDAVSLLVAEPPDSADGNLSEAARLCGYVPLALRIAGTRLATGLVSSVRALVGELRRQLVPDLQAGSSSLTTTFMLSYRGLDGDQAALFRRIGLLDSPVVSAWVAAALMDTSTEQGEHLLGKLWEAHLIDVVDGDDAVRLYRMHDLMKLFARDRARDEEPADTQHAAVARVLAGWLALAETAVRRDSGGSTGLVGSAPRWCVPAEVADALLEVDDWLENEWQNLVAAVTQAARLGEDELCWELALTCFGLQRPVGYHDDAEKMYLTALSATRAAGNRLGTAMLMLGWGGLQVGQQASGRPYLEQALALFGRIGEPRGQAYALRYVAFLNRLHGDLEAALQCCEEGLKLLRAAPDVEIRFFTLLEASHVLMAQGELGAAADLLTKAEALAEQLGGWGHLAHVRTRGGELSYLDGDTTGARRLFTEALRYAERGRSLFLQAHVLGGLGKAQLDDGDYVEARATLTRGMVIAQQAGRARTEAHIAASLVGALAAVGDVAAAGELAESAITRLTDMGMESAAQETRGLMARLG
ncbi:AfsR/SARP family transcriptional regulator [Phytoactinopolyspora limicola]|uniref:AfsR/SARP family transcriptional regulator n=1 Tax=Phytoactinopolyspora limicola TaxID=2715536 RepID=UPI001409C64F|nr:BTAD domain-containing putative transcriptional regulator [Phytoactinopolyspora limicola]